MSHTNETSNLGLPLFVGDDRPTWLGDFNVAMTKIDSKAGTQDASIEGAVSNAQTALNTAQTVSDRATAAINTANDAHAEAVLAEGIANNALTIANNTASLAGLINTQYTDKSSIAPVYDATSTYAIDSLVMYGNKLYKCITAITVGEDFDASKWSEVNVISQIGSGGGVVGDFAQSISIAPNFSTRENYEIDDVVMYEGMLYTFTSAHSAGEWNSSEVSAVSVSEVFQKKNEVTDLVGFSTATDLGGATSRLICSDTTFNLRGGQKIFLVMRPIDAYNNTNYVINMRIGARKPANADDVADGISLKSVTCSGASYLWAGYGEVPDGNFNNYYIYSNGNQAGVSKEAYYFILDPV